MHFLLATTNPGKIVEMREALSGLPATFLTPSDIGSIGAPEEIGTTFAENAAIKSRFFFTQSGLPSIADDSGIHIEALAGELGVQTRRWGAGAYASDAEWIDHFLRRMAHEENRRARFICSIAYTDADGTTHQFDGVCDGSITTSVEAPYLPGLPISGCFRPDGCNRVFSALDVEQKNSTSHRGRALRKLREFLEKEGLLSPPLITPPHPAVP